MRVCGLWVKKESTGLITVEMRDDAPVVIGGSYSVFDVSLRSNDTFEDIVQQQITSIHAYLDKHEIDKIGIRRLSKGDSVYAATPRTLARYKKIRNSLVGYYPAKLITPANAMRAVKHFGFDRQGYKKQDLRLYGTALAELKRWLEKINHKGHTSTQSRRELGQVKVD